MTALLRPFLILAALGFVLSVVVHIASLFGVPQPEDVIVVMSIGVFVVMLPAIMMQHRLIGDFKQKDMWRALFRGCPPGTRWLLYGIGGYVFLNFILAGFALAGGPPPVGAVGNIPAVAVRVVTGHLMFFYAGATAILYSAIQVSRRDPTRRCPNDHPVSPAANFCEECGAEVEPHSESPPAEGSF